MASILLISSGLLGFWLILRADEFHKSLALIGSAEAEGARDGRRAGEALSITRLEGSRWSRAMGFDGRSGTARHDEDASS